jgi:hypothetical protein
VAGSQRDRQLLHYFCVQGSDDISGFISSQFWNQTVLQVSQHEPAVRSALVALSSSHLDHAASNDASTQHHSLEQYGRALRALSKRIEVADNDAIRVALLCCILFYSFSATVGDTAAALQHLDRGLHILTASRQTSHDTLDQSILSTIARLDLQASLFDDSRMPVLQFLSFAGSWNPGVPFNTLHEAQCALDDVQRRIFKFLISNAPFKNEGLENIPPHVMLEKTNLTTDHNTWHDKLTLFVETGQPAPESGVQMLQIHHKLTNMLLDSNFPYNPEPFGACPNQPAHEALDMIQHVLQTARQRNASSGAARNAQHNVSLETGIIAPLSLLAIKCSDEAVCARATRLLGLANRKEGLYDAATMVMVLQRLGAIKLRRMETIEHELQDRSLEFWALDVIDGRSRELEAIQKPVPKTVFHD